MEWASSTCVCAESLSIMLSSLRHAVIGTFHDMSGCGALACNIPASCLTGAPTSAVMADEPSTISLPTTVSIEFPASVLR